MSDLKYSCNVITFKGQNITLKYDVLDAYEIKDTLIVLLNPDSFIGKEKGVKNLIAFNSNIEKIWEAEFPQTIKPDYYWKISSRFPLVVKSFSSSDCEIDLNNGKVLKSIFYK